MDEPRGQWDIRVVPRESSFDNHPWVIMTCTDCGRKVYLRQANPPHYEFCPYCGMPKEVLSDDDNM